MTYEIMKPETIGLSTNKLVLGKHSGRHALRSRLKEMGYDLSDEEINLVFTRFKELADKKKHVVDEDLEVIVTEGILRTSDIFNLEYLHVTSGTTVLPMASVKLDINGRPAQGAGYGNGPIDAAFNAIADLTGTGSELLRFSDNLNRTGLTCNKISRSEAGAQSSKTSPSKIIFLGILALVMAPFFPLIFLLFFSQSKKFTKSSGRHDLVLNILLPRCMSEIITSGPVVV